MKKFLALSAAIALLAASPAHATTIKEVTSPGGIKAWLVEDHKLPLIAMQFAFRGGVEQDPADKQGLANLTMELLTEGAGDLDAAAFQQQLSDHSVGMKFEASRDALEGSIKALVQEKDTAFNLLHLAVTEPRFDKDAFERERNQQLTGIRMQLGNPEWQARYAMFQYIFGNHPYGERRLGSTETLSHITINDVKTFALNHMARNNLIVAVAGDISPRELGAQLDKVFGDLPKHAKLQPVSEINWPKNTATIALPREGTQTSILFAMPGPKRDDKDWYAAEIANYILGGGGFSSRLMQDVRDKKGLTYGISTGISPMEHGSVIIGEAATDNPKTAQALDVVNETMRHFYEEGVSEKEVEAAKDYLTGSLPLAMTSTDKIAGVLASIQMEHLGPLYLERRNDLLRRVTVDDVNRTVQRWFNPAGMVLTLVGKPEGVTSTQSQNLIRN